MTWLAIIIAPAASVVTLWLANRHAAKLAVGQAAEAQKRWQFEARERRYDDRREAVIAYDSAANKEVDRIDEFSQDPYHTGLSPGDIHDDYRFPDLMDAFARVSLLATPQVIEAAQVLQDIVREVFNAKDGSWERYYEALESYRVAARRMLTSDSAMGSQGGT